MSSKRKHGNGNGNGNGNNNSVNPNYIPLPQREKKRKSNQTIMNIGARFNSKNLEAYKKQKAIEEAQALAKSINNLSMKNKKGGFRNNKKLKTKKNKKNK